jgi:putative membrane protein
MYTHSQPGGPSPQEIGQEPDYRFSLANERTFLSWLRSSLALLAAGVAVSQLVPSLAPRPQRLVLGLVLVALSLLVATTSHRRWRQVDIAIRLGRPLPPSRIPVILAIGLSLVITATMIMLIIG